MRNIKLTIRYDGTSYSGWQFQKNSRKTIQAVIERASHKITGEKSHLTGSGRTDAGVHATGQVANFRTRSKIPLKNIQMALNAMLPDDIAISAIDEAGPKFNSQKSARSRLYRYTIYNNNFMDPLMRRYAAKIFYSLDLARMKKAAKYLAGRHDFTSFQKRDEEKRSAVCTVKYIRIEKDGDLIYIDIEANGFVYNMVRNIVGTIIETGRGKFSVSRVKEILDKKDIRCCGPTMAAKGLCLVKVRY